MAEQRYQAVLAVIAEGGTVAEVAGRWGVSRQSVHSRPFGMALRATPDCDLRRHMIVPSGWMARTERCPGACWLSISSVVIAMTLAGPGSLTPRPNRPGPDRTA